MDAKPLIHPLEETNLELLSHVHPKQWRNPDGDEVYDPIGLSRFKKDLISGVYDGEWLLLGNVLHCIDWNQKEDLARGYRGKSMTKLYNFNAIYSWPGNSERFHNPGSISFKAGYHNKMRRKLYFEYDWVNSPFRCLHLCFMHRSSIRSFSKTRPGPADAENNEGTDRSCHGSALRNCSHPGQHTRNLITCSIDTVLCGVGSLVRDTLVRPIGTVKSLEEARKAAADTVGF